jgi:hypothetical protein
MSTDLIAIEISKVSAPMPELAARFVEEAVRRSRSINCFDFVPSNAENLHAVLASLPRGRFCEWGSGMGIGVGLATMLGFAASGVEIHRELVEESRRLLTDYQLAATITLGDYFEHPQLADYYFTYCWPGQMNRVEQLFWDAAPHQAKLLICHGADDLRCKVKRFASNAASEESLASEDMRGGTSAD